jgi:hypothetical protein
MTFKFFRKYNKWLIAFGISALMVVFLVEGAVPMLTQQNPDKVIVGKLRGKPISHTQYANAGNDFEILSQTGFNVSSMGQDARQIFVLFALEANRLGIHHSATEAYQTLSSNGVNELDLKILAARLKIRPDQIIQAVQTYLAVGTYIDLTLGRAGGNAGNLSELMIQRLAYDLESSASASGVVIPVEKAVGTLPPVTDAQLTKLFDQYKDSLPGQSKPYGFGYKSLPAVQIEYLEIPAHLINAKIKVDEVELQDYYDKNKHEFVVEPAAGATQPAAPVYKPYEEVAATIRSDLKTRKTNELADRVIRFAANILSQSTQALTDKDGYKVIPEGYKPLSLESVLNQVKQQFDITPTVRIEGSEWYDTRTIMSVGGISFSSITGRQSAMFSGYVMSTRELLPAKDNPYTALRLQVGVASVPMSGFDNSRYIFRVTAAKPAQVPDSLDKVKPYVLRDAQKLAAWELVQKDPQALIAKAAVQPSMAAYAQSLGLNLIKLPPSPAPEARFRRKNFRNGSFVTPLLAEIGQSEPFVDAIFTKAVDLKAKGPIEAAPLKDRIVVVPLEGQMSVAVFTVDGLIAPPKFEVDKLVREPETALGLQQALSAPPGPDFFALKNIQKRLNYVPANEEQATTAPAK